MLHQSALITPGNPAGNGIVENIKSRFGDITVSTDKALSFPRGLLGMPDKSRFVVANFPNAKMQQFMLLQSLDDHGLSFITLPLNLDNNIVAADDIRNACRDLQVPDTNLAILLIVSVHRGFDQVRLSVNARAPLLIDVERRVGVQYVFPQDHYKVQHML